MFTKQTVFLTALLAVASGTKIQPTTSADEAMAQCKELETIVQDEIQTAFDELNQIVIAFFTYSKNVTNDGTISIQQMHGTVLAELQSMKDLAHAGGVDPSSCSDIREQTLNRLPQRYAEQIAICITDLDDHVSTIAENAKYIVDVSFNTVKNLEYQIQRCKKDIPCISSVVSEIELDKSRLPQNIKTEVQACQATTTTLKMALQMCADDKVAQYGIEAYSILKDIQDCIDRLLG